MIDLKPCPFCGGIAKQLTIEDDIEPSIFWGDIIQCSDCLASSRVEFGRKENIVSAWNTRTTPTLSATEPAHPTPAQIMADPRVTALVDELENEAISHEEDSEHCDENGNDSSRVYHSNRAKKLRSLLAQLKDPKP